MTKLTGAALDRAVANAMGLKSVNNCEQWGKEMTEEDDDIQEYKKPWVGLPTVVILDIYAETLKEHRGGSMPDGQIAFAKAIEQALKERNNA
jgi:hypothetical protein